MCLPQLRTERNLRCFILLCVAVTLWGFFRSTALAGDSAVILMYHRFGETDHAQTNITIEQFEWHLAELENSKYTVLPIPEILRKLKAGTSLPERTIGISIDDAFLSVFTEAFPRLKQRSLPFTLFIATQPVDLKLPDYMNWDQIRELRDAGVTIGSQTHTHLHMAQRSPADSSKDVKTANERFVAELGQAPKLMAYPYGEAGLASMTVVRDLGFEFAFGQHSGVLHKNSPPYFLPRFGFNEEFGSKARFRLIANALPLPVHEVAPRNPLVVENPPAFGFTIDSSIAELSQLSCYHSQQGKVGLERLGSHRIEVRFPRAFETGRSRLNCTLPGPENRWRWYGRQFYTKTSR
jgi:peptidoglycan/xylan/chitin deacetylase (PgdA/CDA1 family)